LLRLGNPADDVYIDIHHVSKGHRPSLKEWHMSSLNVEQEESV
jgi:hypothetical protein